tara:strand:+ start:1173 stop:1421 length:249 start_codon:yes stop_codon:yes gene_type:complete
MKENLLKKYKMYFGDDAKIPPEHIMETLVEMKERGTYGSAMEKVALIYGDLDSKIEKATGQKIVSNHPMFDINFNGDEKKDD